MGANRNKTSPTYTVGQVAQRLGASGRYVQRLIDDGKLEGFRLPNSSDRRVSREALALFVRANNLPITMAEPCMRVLCVGMDRTQYDELRRALPEDGSYSFAYAATLFEAGQIIETRGHEVVILDAIFGLPETLAVARIIRSHPTHKHTRLYALLSEDTPKTVKTSPVFADALWKPFNVYDLAAMVEQG